MKNLTRKSFEHIFLKDLKDTRVIDCTFYRCTFNKTLFEDCQFFYCDFYECDFTNFSFGYLEEVNFIKCKFDRKFKYTREIEGNCGGAIFFNCCFRDTIEDNKVLQKKDSVYINCQEI